MLFKRFKKILKKILNKKKFYILNIIKVYLKYKN